MSRVYERNLKLNWGLSPADLHKQALAQLASSESIIRCVFEADTSEVGLIDTLLPTRTPFSFQHRTSEDQAQFNVAYIVPTGVGAAQGGHAGDATPVLKAIASMADTVFTHPNVVNASDVNEISDNALYVEGSLLAAFLMGTIGLVQRRGNRIIAILGQHHKKYVEAAINTINAARATYGLDCLNISVVPFTMEASWTPSGRASGEITGLDNIWQEIDKHRGAFDAIAVTSPITMDAVARDYYLKETAGESVNPWGGIEALLTHAIAAKMQVPVAHAPMMESLEVEELDYGIVDARVAAEMISLSYLQCVLKGLQRAPAVTNPTAPNAFSAQDVNALVIPQGCFGIPVYAALHQGIRVIAVADKIYSKDQTDIIRSLPWSIGQYTEVNNYPEALGVLACLKAGISPASIKRPLKTMSTTVPTRMPKMTAQNQPRKASPRGEPQKNPQRDRSSGY